MAGCARIHARGFWPTDAPTIASMLPGIEEHYLKIAWAAR
jgi:hypothetical protein